MGRGGYRQGGGRPKGSKNKANLKIDEILATEGANLVHQAVRLAKLGNAAVLCKLLDKVLPTLTDNKNVNFGANFEDFILGTIDRAVDATVAERRDTEPVPVQSDDEIDDGAEPDYTDPHQRGGGEVSDNKADGNNE